MLILRLWNYIRGYVIILVEGYFAEKFLNICSHRQIFLWDIQRHKDGALTLKISIKGFKLLRGITRRTGCHVRILKKKGLPFILNRYRQRKAFVFGVVVFFLIIYFLTSFIWAVEIAGNVNLDTTEITQKLNETGIKPGVLKYRIDTDKAVNYMMLEMKELAWISIMVRGTKVKVRLSERKMPPELVQKDEPCNIVARHDGIIKSIIAKDGIEKVSVGDTVTKGQVLVSGEIPIRGEEGKTRLVHAIASVRARTWYEKRYRVLLKTTEKVRTGEKIDNYKIVFFNRKIDLFNRKIGFEHYEKEEIEKRLEIGEDIVFPFEIVIDRYYENHIINKEVNIDNAKQSAADGAYNDVLNEIQDDAQIIKVDASFLQDGENSVTAIVTVECLEEIGVKERIGGN